MKLLAWLVSSLLLRCSADPDAARKAVAMLAAASAREAQLAEADQKYLRRFQDCQGKACDELRSEYEKSRSSYQNLEEQALKSAKRALAPLPLHSHVSKKSRASTESHLHKLVFVASAVGLMIAAFLSGRHLGCKS